MEQDNVHRAKGGEGITSTRGEGVDVGRKLEKEGEDKLSERRRMYLRGTRYPVLTSSLCIGDFILNLIQEVGPEIEYQ